MISARRTMGTILALLIGLGGCAGIMAPERRFEDFVMVVPRDSDTFETLAQKYLNDSTQGWMIAEYNGIDAITAGQEIVVPLKLPSPGKVTTRQYQTVPVLCYHNFSRDVTNAMTVTGRDFDAQMQFLQDKGYHVIPLDSLFDFIEYKKPIPDKSVVITVDDGWRSFYDIAFPILKKYNYPATLFIYIDMIEETKKSTLNWKQVQELAMAGIDIQNHTKTHRNLKDLKQGESVAQYFKSLQEELIGSTRVIKEKLNKDIKYIAYPYGDTNDITVAILRKNGYRGAFTVKRGSAPFFIDQFRVNRSVIYGAYDMKKFERNLTYVSSKALR